MRFRIYDEKKFDSVSMMRSIRDRISAEIEGMSLEEEPQWLASQEIRDPFLKRFRHRAVQQPVATDGVRARADPERSAAKELPAVVGGRPPEQRNLSVSRGSKAMSKSVVLLGALALSVFIGAQEVRTQEEPVPEAKIPKAVMNALLAKFPAAKIDKCTKAREGGETVYDIEFKQEGRKCEADIKENGTYINYEKAIEVNDLPRAVRDAVEKRYPKATLKDVMEETEVKGKAETLSAYEVVLVTADQKEAEVRLSPDGKILEDTGAKKPDEKK